MAARAEGALAEHRVARAGEYVLHVAPLPGDLTHDRDLVRERRPVARLRDRLHDDGAVRVLGADLPLARVDVLDARVRAGWAALREGLAVDLRPLGVSGRVGREAIRR